MGVCIQGGTRSASRGLHLGEAMGWADPQPPRNIKAGSMHPTEMLSYYCLQTKYWGKVIFSEVCVKNSVHGGRGVSQHALQVT